MTGISLYFRKITLFLKQPVITGVLTAVLFSFLSAFILWQRYQILKKAEQREMSNLINLVENNIDQTLKNSYSVALSLALLIDTKGNIENFEGVAPGLVEDNPNIDAVQLVPGGVITKVYPVMGNRDVLNYDILSDSLRSKEAYYTMRSKDMYFAGPLELKQGGMAVVGRLPVYIQNDFWGFSAVIIKLETLIKQSGIEQLSGNKYRFQFSKVDPSTADETYFLPQFQHMDRSYVESISLPEGDWRFYISPESPWELLYGILPIGFFMLLLSLWLGWAMTNLLKQPARLQALVKVQAGELARSELKFRTIFNQAAIGIARVDSLTGAFLETNKRFRQLFGYKEEDLKHLNYMKITMAEDLQEDLQHMTRLNKGEIGEFTLEKRIIKKSGDMIWVNLTVSPLWNKGETPTTHLALLEDINDKKQAETNLRKSYEMLMEQNKRLLNFSYIVSHNLRSHSSNIESILSLYHMSETDTERMQYMELLEKVSIALTDTLFDLNEVVSIQTNLDLSVENIQVEQYVRQIWDLLKMEIDKKKAILTVNIPPSMVVPFNAAYMESVLLNLMTNSLRYSHPLRTPAIEIKGSLEDGTWILLFKDNGIGIDMKKNADKIFGLYKTFSNNRFSRGVGLFITKNQVEAMGGRIEVESELGVGTSFKIYFK